MKGYSLRSKSTQEWGRRVSTPGLDVPHVTVPKSLAASGRGPASSSVGARGFRRMWPRRFFIGFQFCKCLSIAMVHFKFIIGFQFCKCLSIAMAFFGYGEGVLGAAGGVVVVRSAPEPRQRVERQRVGVGLG